MPLDFLALTVGVPILVANPTKNEQLLLEYINHTRLDPLGSATMYISSYRPLASGDADVQSALTYFRVSGSALKSAFSALSATQPLAWNGNLGTAADAHSAKMIAADEQSHQLSGEASLGSRIRSTGYVYGGLGENIYAYADSMLHAHAGFMVDWGFGANGMQDGAGHRSNIMNSGHREVGLGVIQETNAATDVGPWVVTEDFGVRFNSPEVFLLGVSYADHDDNQFYTPGEGRSGMTINASGATGQSTSSGGYVVEMGAGTKTITFSGGKLTSSLSVSASLSAGSNAKIDVCDQSTLLTSVSLTVLRGVTEVRALGIQGLALTGTTGNQKLVGNSGANTLNGGAGADILVGGAGNDVLNGGSGADTLVGGTGRDRLIGGLGNDRFDFNALSEMGVTSATRDIISDFVRGQDRIDLAGLDANAATSTNEAFSGTFVAARAAFTAARQLKFSGGVLYGNTDSDADAEFALQLTGIATLSASDLIL